MLCLRGKDRFWKDSEPKKHELGKESIPDTSQNWMDGVGCCSFFDQRRVPHFQVICGRTHPVPRCCCVALHPHGLFFLVGPRNQEAPAEMVLYRPRKGWRSSKCTDPVRPNLLQKRVSQATVFCGRLCVTCSAASQQRVYDFPV